MEFYSAIPEFAAYLGCTYDEVVAFTALCYMAFFMVIGIAVSCAIDVGHGLYRLGKKGVSSVCHKLKKK